MGVPAPRAPGTDKVTSSAVLEPAYEVGGDAFDHGLDDGRRHRIVVDAMGHDLAGGWPRPSPWPAAGPSDAQAAL
ncbi:MAG: hypothetical protein JF597_50215 [Streptomyces sp.]|uniref:hypothetical protein n=1 Tax=Streptomyces sp. TaxID=1931 RepID=UPI0025E50059|nr:hypothetical protein [Streptomyces sp.]MBW8801433.1 hypothetical protein [Streptomyces sp.]